MLFGDDLPGRFVSRLIAAAQEAFGQRACFSSKGFRAAAAAALGTLCLIGCSTAPRLEVEPQKPAAEEPAAEESAAEEPAQAAAVFGRVGMTPAAFSELPATEDSDWEAALKAFRASCTVMGKEEPWKEVCANAEDIPEGLARAFFEGNFEPWRVSDANAGSATAAAAGLMTGYYEPILRASRTRHGIYQYPIYGVPDDLVVVDLASLYPQLKGLRLRGKLQGKKLVPYDDRSGISERSDLFNRVICWADDPVEVFFLQIQGSGRVLLDSGEMIRVGYADQNGHPYRSPGAWLIENAGLMREEMSMQRIKKWVQDNPQRRQELLNANPHFVFFSERKGYADDQGPIGAQSVPLTPLASVAVDRRYWKLGTPFVVDVQQNNPALAFARPVIAQDTGGAIKGVIRFDYFWGLGERAGQLAGSQKSEARAWVMVPKGYGPNAVLSR